MIARSSAKSATPSRRRDICHFADTPSPSPIETPTEGIEEVQRQWQSRRWPAPPFPSSSKSSNAAATLIFFGRRPLVGVVAAELPRGTAQPGWCQRDAMANGYSTGDQRDAMANGYSTGDRTV